MNELTVNTNMELINIVLSVIAALMAKRAYRTNRPLLAMFWAMLFGWNLHIVLTDLLV